MYSEEVHGGETMWGQSVAGAKVDMGGSQSGASRIEGLYASKWKMDEFTTPYTHVAKTVVMLIGYNI